MSDLKQNENIWNQSEQNLGVVTPGTVYPVEFEYLGKKKIKTVETQCGCTIPEHPKGNLVKVNYTPKKKPAHITGDHTVTKSVTVTFEDDTKAKAYFKSTVK